MLKKECWCKMYNEYRCKNVWMMNGSVNFLIDLMKLSDSWCEMNQGFHCNNCVENRTQTVDKSNRVGNFVWCKTKEPNESDKTIFSFRATSTKYIFSTNLEMKKP